MKIKRVYIKNFKCFHEEFKLKFNYKMNIIVGDNDAGKSTILEAIYLALTGIFRGKNLIDELTESLFNKKTVENYINNLNNKIVCVRPPEITIKVFFEKEYSISLRIAFGEYYGNEYQDFIKQVKSTNIIPIEYYKVFWKDSNNQGITTNNIPIKASLINTTIDSSDTDIKKLVNNFLKSEEKNNIAGEYQIIRDGIKSSNYMCAINKRLQKITKGSANRIGLSFVLSPKIACTDDIPFDYLGKGEQSIINTHLTLSQQQSQRSNLLVLEEPENHLSHTNLNILLGDIEKNLQKNQQMITATHSSFVVNKLGFKKIILLSRSRDGTHKTLLFSKLDPKTQDFFKKLSGYDTLRLLLCKAAVLVEGPSDELIFQRFFMDRNSGKLPIQCGIDVISVGTSFIRFLEIAEFLDNDVMVITDNDGNVARLKKKFHDYLGTSETGEKYDNIKIFYEEDEINHTLEPSICNVNDFELLCSIIKPDDEKLEKMEDLKEYMLNPNNKTEVALKIFKSKKKINMPNSIKNAIEHLSWKCNGINRYKDN